MQRWSKLLDYIAHGLLYGVFELFLLCLDTRITQSVVSTVYVEIFRDQDLQHTLLYLPFLKKYLDVLVISRQLTHIDSCTEIFKQWHHEESSLRNDPDIKKMQALISPCELQDEISAISAMLPPYVILPPSYLGLLKKRVAMPMGSCQRLKMPEWDRLFCSFICVVELGMVVSYWVAIGHGGVRDS